MLWILEFGFWVLDFGFLILVFLRRPRPLKAPEACLRRAHGRFLHAGCWEVPGGLGTHIIYWYKGHGQVASEGRKRARILSEKGFWEGGVIPNACSDARSLANFQV